MGDLNERVISLEEVGEAVNEMKSGNASGLDGFLVWLFKERCYGNAGVIVPTVLYGAEAWGMRSAEKRK